MAPNHHYMKRQPERVTTFKIYLSNLPDSLQNSELKALFEEYGRTVECEVFKKNYAFVHMEEEVCGRNAVMGLNRKEIDGKVISVSVSKNLEPPNIARTKLSVKNLPLNMNAVGLRKLFQKFGLVLEAEISRTGDGIVSMEATGDIRTAINEIGAMEMEGKKLLVEAVKVNLKAEKQYGHPPSQMDWNATSSGAGYSRQQHFRQESRPPANAHYALGGGYSAQAQAEEFYGNQQEEYYEEEEYFEEDYYPPAVYPPPEYEAPVGRYGGMGPSLLRPQYASRGRGGHPVLRAGVDFMRRGDTSEYYEDEPIEPSYGMPLMEHVHMVPRNPQTRGGMGFAQPRGGGRGFGGGRGRGGPRGRGRGAQQRAPIPIPKRKVVRGEPYPTPPVPPARMLLGQGPRGGMRPRAPFQPRGGPIRPKSRGERGGKHILTAGKLAKLRELESSGVNVPDDFEGRMELINQFGFTPILPKPKQNGVPPPDTHTNLPDSSSGGAYQGPSLLATARAAAAAQAAATAAGGGYSADSDPFGPSAVEKRYFQQQEQKNTIPDSGIDFTADIMLS